MRSNACALTEAEWNLNCASRLRWNSSKGQCNNQTSIFHCSRSQILSQHALGKRQENTLERSSVQDSNKLAIINMFDWDAWRCQPTTKHVMCCQVAWQSDRMCWYFTLANHKTRTRRGGSVFAEMILQPEQQSSGSRGVAQFCSWAWSWLYLEQAKKKMLNFGNYDE